MMKDYGEVYGVLRYKDSTIIKYFKNGILNNSGDFNTAVFKMIHKSDDTLEKHYLNPQNKYNLNLPFQISKNIKLKNDDFFVQYFDDEKNRITYKNIYQKLWKYIPENKVISNFYDKKGNQITQSDGIYQDRRTLDSIGRVILIESLGKNGKLSLDKSDLSSAVSYSYDDNNNLKKRTYFNFYGKHAKHIDQYNLSFKYNPLGEVSERIVLDEENAKIEDKNGIGIYKYWYDLNGNLIQTKRFNRKGYPVLGTEDYFKSVTDYDDRDKVIFDAKYYFLNTLKFNENSKWGASKYQYQGDSIELIYNYDVYNNHFNDDAGIATIKNYLNKEGLIWKTQYLDKNGNFSKTDDNVVQFLYEYDNNGNTIEETTLDSLSNKIIFSEDVATVKWEYNKDNEKIKTIYYTEQGNLANANQGSTYDFFVRNKENQIIEVAHYSKKMQPVEIDGIHKTNYIVNRFGKDSIIKYFNKNNKLIEDGIAIIKYKYNLYSSLIEESYLDSNEKPIGDDDGIIRLRYLLNDEQQNTGYKLYDENFRRINGRKKYHHEKITLDDYGYVIMYEYFDKNKKPISLSDGYHKLVYERDSLGEVIREAKYNRFGNLTNGNTGIAEYKYTRSKTGLIESIKTYNSKGELVNNDSGVAETYYHSYLNGLYFLDKELDKDGNNISEDEN